MNRSYAHPDLLEQVRTAIRRKKYSPHTEENYVYWASRFLCFLPVGASSALEEADVEAFLVDLARYWGVSEATCAQARSAVHFLFREVLGKKVHAELPHCFGEPPEPVVLLDRHEVRALLQAMAGPTRIAAELLYGCGLRVRECVNLRIGDIDLPGGTVTVRRRDGAADRLLPLPEDVVAAVESHLDVVRLVFRAERAVGAGWAPVPGFDRMEEAPLSCEWAHQYAIYASVQIYHSRARVFASCPMQAAEIQAALRDASYRSRVGLGITCRALRYCFAAHRLEDGESLRQVQQWLGLKTARAALVYESAYRSAVAAGVCGRPRAGVPGRETRVAVGGGGNGAMRAGKGA